MLGFFRDTAFTCLSDAGSALWRIAILCVASRERCGYHFLVTSTQAVAIVEPPSVDVGLVEDERATRDRFERVLNATPSVRLAFSVGSIEAAKRALEHSPVNVLLADLGLPDGSGLELIRHCRLVAPHMEIMVVSMFADEGNMIGAFQAGARGYILKDGTESDLARHVHSIHAGGSPITPVIARQLLARLNPASNATLASKESAAQEVGLTQRERQILGLLSRGYTYAEVARLSGVSVSTIQTHIKSLYAKLEVHSKSEAVYEARQMGLL